MRLLGIDYGEKRVGISLSDQSGGMAFPHSTLENKGFSPLAKKILEIAQKEKVKKIVVGLSLDFKGKENLIMKNLKKFTKVLEETTGLNVIFEDEMFTTALAMRIQGKNKMTDASAATIILQSYIEHRKKEIMEK